MTTNEKLSAQVIAELEQENQRLRELLCACWRHANDPGYYCMDKYAIKDTIAIVEEMTQKDAK